MSPSILGGWWPVFLAPLLSLLLIHGLIRPARHFGCVDHPGGRKRHDVPTPLVGGIAIYLAFVVMSGLQGRIPGESWSLFAAMLVTVVFGLADDVRQFGHRTKFFGQLVAALIVVSGTSVHVMVFGDLLGAGPLDLGKWAYLVTVICFIGLMNAVNMIDGIDGLAGTLAVMPLSLLAVAAATVGEQSLAREILVLVGAIAGFLACNLRTPWRRHALVFMGDAGGLLLGLLLGWYTIKLAGVEGGALRPITAVWLVAVPLLDMGSVMLLRILQGESPFHADRQHMHHVLLDAGYSVSQVVAIIAALALSLGLAALYAEHAGVPEDVMFYGFLGLWAGYLLALARPRLMRRLVRRFVGSKEDAPQSHE